MFTFGMKGTLPRGHKGERPDFYAGKIVSNPRTERVDGRLIEVADVITAEKTRAGEWRLAKRLQDLQYFFPARRPDADPEAILLLDGPSTQPKSVQELITEQALSAMAYLEGRPASINEMALADIEA